MVVDGSRLSGARALNPSKKRQTPRRAVGDTRCGGSWEKSAAYSVEGAAKVTTSGGGPTGPGSQLPFSEAPPEKIAETSSASISRS